MLFILYNNCIIDWDSTYFFNTWCLLIQIKYVNYIQPMIARAYFDRRSSTFKLVPHGQIPQPADLKMRG